MMASKFETKGRGYKRDVINLAILVFVASSLGAYLIATTVLIARDGVFYIERAQKLSSDPIGIIEAHPPGYEFLIFAAHKFVSLFIDSSSVCTWIYSAQSVNLLCRVLALVPLYFIGKLLVGSRSSFLALVVLIFLPYPAEYGSDVLRDWPHTLFLATGLLFLLRGAKQGKLWMFGVVGLVAGFGHIIRPECAQLVLYGVLWLLVGLFLQKRDMNRLKLICALFVLLVGFAVPTAPYIEVRGKSLPGKLKALIVSSCCLQKEKVQESNNEYMNNVYAAESSSANVANAIGRLIREISNNLMHFFVPAWLFGIHSRFRRKSVSTNLERYFVIAFVVFNVITMILLYSGWGYISRRHSMPLIVFTIFYVPVGFQVLADWFVVGFSKGQQQNNRKSQLCFFILVITGLAICTPKLLRPIRADKKAYRTAAQWLKENTQENDLIAVSDNRISFYAERKGLEYERNIPIGAQYAVAFVKDEDEKYDANKDVRKELSLWIDQHKKTKKIVIYKVF